jgi:hypothetical protein
MGRGASAHNLLARKKVLVQTMERSVWMKKKRQAHICGHFQEKSNDIMISCNNNFI